MTLMPPSGSNLRGAVDLSSLLKRPSSSATDATAPGVPVAPGAQIPVPRLIVDGTDANFGELLELSNTVPVLVNLWAEWSEPCKQLMSVLERLVLEFAGRFVLARVDVDSNPQLSQAFQAQSIPTVAAVIGGQPVQLFNGALPEEQIREVLTRVLELAAQQGVTGSAAAGEAAPVAVEPVEEPLSPHHAEAYAAIERGDYDTAQAEYRTAIAQDPNDTMAVAGFAQASLLRRLHGKTLDEIRGGAAAAPNDLQAQLLVADLDLSGGHVDDAFDRLLLLFPAQDAAGRNEIRERILELFEVIGTEDPRVAPARKRLTALLY